MLATLLELCFKGRTEIIFAEGADKGHWIDSLIKKEEAVSYILQMKLKAVNVKISLLWYVRASGYNTPLCT